MWIYVAVVLGETAVECLSLDSADWFREAVIRIPRIYCAFWVQLCLIITPRKVDDLNTS